MRPIELQKGIIYGPVTSRRLGRSLGLNLMPTTLKVCSLNCSYCQYGWTSKLTDSGDGYRNYFPTVQQILLNLKEVFEQRNDFDYLTFSGNGEPTLHPDFPQIVDRVFEMKAYFRSDVKLAILSNSTSCLDLKIRYALSKIDLPIMKLDVGNERAFKKINRAAPGVSFRSLVDGLKSLQWFVLQTMFVQGANDNTRDEEVETWIDALQEVHPLWIQIYSLDRVPAFSKLRKVPAEKLKQIAELAAKRTGLRVEVYDGI
ncbi:MAG: radical SAM protein [bacterium]